jgi:hypothetical protein
MEPIECMDGQHEANKETASYLEPIDIIAPFDNVGCFEENNSLIITLSQTTDNINAYNYTSKIKLRYRYNILNYR